MKNFKLKALSTLIAVSALVGFGTSHAAEFAAGPMYGGLNQNVVVCYLYNAGTTAVSISGQIIRLGVGPLALTSNSCTASFVGGGMCGMSAAAVAGAAYGCKFSVSDAVNLRGTLEIRQQGIVLQNTPLR